MTKKTLARIIMAALIAAVLGGAALIIARSNTGVGAEAPTGFFH